MSVGAVCEPPLQSLLQIFQYQFFFPQILIQPPLVNCHVQAEIALI
jgi:hypothetical protein